MISAKSAILCSSQALETEVELTLSAIEEQVMAACSKNAHEVVTHVIVNHPSFLVRKQVYETIRSLGYMVIREFGEEGYQWHSISWSAPEEPEDKPWWKVWP